MLKKLLLALALGMTLIPSVHAQSIAFTFDDGPELAETPRMSPQQRNQAMLNALAQHKVKAALFVTVGNGAGRPAGLALARAWGQAGNAVGNHTMRHPNFDNAQVSLAQFQQELIDCDAVISTLPGYQKWFRFPYLREGNVPEKRDGMRAFMKAQAYRNAYVSLDTRDWRLNQKLIEVLKSGNLAAVGPIREAYLAHVRQRAQAYRSLSHTLQGRDIAQVILLHYNLINAMWLDDVIVMFKQMGWTITTPEAAFADPAYQLVPERETVGQSLLLSMARSLGVGQFEGWSRLVDDGDHEIAALKAQGI